MAFTNIKLGLVFECKRKVYTPFIQLVGFLIAVMQMIIIYALCVWKIYGGLMAEFLF